MGIHVMAVLNSSSMTRLDEILRVRSEVAAITDCTHR